MKVSLDQDTAYDAVTERVYRRDRKDKCGNPCCYCCFINRCPGLLGCATVRAPFRRVDNAAIPG